MGPRQAGGTVNFQVVGGVNGSTNFIKVTSFTPGFIDQGSFFNGADYAFIDAAGFVRAPQYGVDSGFSAADALTAGTHGLVSGNDSVGSTTLNTVKLTSGSSLTISGGSTLNLNNSGILKSGGGSATISGGNILPAFNTELVIRVDQAGDNLTINSVIQDNGTTSGGTLLTKSGAGTLTLGVANTFAGKLNLLAGTVVVANPLALQNTMVSLVNNGGQIQFASGTTTAVFGALTSAVGANGTLTLQDQSAAPVNLTVQISDSPTLPLSLDGFSRINVLNGLITGSGSLTIVANNTDGRYDFNAANTFTGGVTVLSGRVQANQQALGANGLDTSMGTGPITLNGGSFNTHGSAVSVSFNNAFVFNGSASFNTASANNATLNGNVSGSGTVVRGGTGTLVFNGTDDSGFTGSFISTAGNVTFNDLAASSAGGSWAFNSNATTGVTITINSSISGTANFGSLIGAPFNNLTFVDTNTASSIVTSLQIGNRNENTTFAGNITTATTNVMTLVKVGSGTLTLGGTSSNYAGVTIQQGTLAVSTLDNATSAASISTGPLGLATSIAIGATGTLQYTGAGNSSFRTFVLSSGAALDGSGSGAVTYSNTAPLAFDVPGTAHAVTLTGTGTTQNTLAAQIINNGTGSVSLVKSGSGVWALSNTANSFSGGIAINAGQLMLANGTVGNAGGTGLISVGSTATLAGTGTTTAPVQVNSGGHISGGLVSNNHIGTLNFGSTLTLVGGAIIDVDILSPSAANDLINFVGSGSLNITGGPGTVAINLFNAGQASNYFYNGTYNLFTGIVAAASANVASTLSSLFIANEGGTGGTFVIGQSTGSGSSILVTITNAWNNSNWSNAATTSIWTDSNDWIGGIPNGSGHIATFGTLVTLGGTVTMNGPKTLNNLTFNNTNGYTINPTNIATDTLTLANGTSNVATLAAAAGSHTINANLVFTSSLVNVSAASGRTLTLNGSITGGGSASISSSGVVVYGGAATYAGITSIASTATLQLGNEVIGTATTNGSASSGVSTLVVASTAGLAATNVVAGAGIQPGTTILSITGTTIALSAPTTAIIPTASSIAFNSVTSSGSVSGPIDLTLGTLSFKRSDAISFDVVNLVQTGGQGSLTQNGTGVLSLSASGGSVFSDNLRVNSGVVKLLNDNMIDASTRGNFELTGTGKLDMNGHNEDIRGLFNEGDPVGGILDNSTATPVLLGIHSGAAHTFTGTITNSGGGALSILKDNNGGILTLTGLVNNSGSIDLTGGQIIYTNTASSTLGGLIVMGRTTTGSAGLLLGAGVNVSTPVLLTAAEGNNEFVSNATNNTGTGTFSGNITIDPSYFSDVRLGNWTATGTLTMAGTLTVPSQNFAEISRNRRFGRHRQD